MRYKSFKMTNDVQDLMANLAIESQTSNSFMDYEDHPILISLISPPKKNKIGSHKDRQNGRRNERPGKNFCSFC